MNKQFCYAIIFVAYLIYGIMRYATKGEKNIVIELFLYIYFFCATMLLGMTLVL